MLFAMQRGSVSVLVCTANRNRQLEELLASLSALTVPDGVSAELVLVNNHPSSDLTPLIKGLGPEFPLAVSVVLEPARGLGKARNRGLGAASGAILAATDDDCIVDSEWLANLMHCFDADPELMMLGGRVELANADDQPITVRSGAAPETLRSAGQVFGFLHGCNMAFRRELLDRIGRFDPRFGAGSPLQAGEDADLVYRAHQAGAKIRYEPSVVVLHAHSRRTRGQARAALNRYHQANGAILAKHAGNGDREAVALLRGVFVGPWTSLRRRPYSAVGTLRACYHSAMFGLGALRGRFHARGQEN